MIPLALAHLRRSDLMIQIRDHRRLLITIGINRTLKSHYDRSSSRQIRLAKTKIVDKRSTSSEENPLETTAENAKRFEPSTFTRLKVTTKCSPQLPQNMEPPR